MQHCFPELCDDPAAPLPKKSQLEHKTKHPRDQPASSLASVTGPLPLSQLCLHRWDSLASHARFCAHLAACLLSCLWSNYFYHMLVPHCVPDHQGLCSLHHQWISCYHLATILLCYSSHCWSSRLGYHHITALRCWPCHSDITGLPGPTLRFRVVLRAGLGLFTGVLLQSRAITPALHIGVWTSC